LQEEEERKEMMRKLSESISLLGEKVCENEKKTSSASTSGLIRAEKGKKKGGRGKSIIPSLVVEREGGKDQLGKRGKGGVDSMREALGGKKRKPQRQLFGEATFRQKEEAPLSQGLL